MERFIKIYDKLIDSQVFKNAKLLKVWIWCLLKATYKPFDAIVGRQVIPLESGQFVFGLHIASSILGIPKTTLYSYMKTLEKMGNIRMKSENKFTIVTIENWASYQVDDVGTESKRKTNGKQTETYKNINNIYNNQSQNNKFVKPTISEIKQYCLDNNYPINPEYFYDYYESKGWMVGKNHMKDWKASVRTWNTNMKKNAQPEVPKVKY